MSQLSFGNIILAQSSKQGILKPDTEGYYLLNAGGFNVPNRHGTSYTANQYIQDCMSPDSDLRRRIERGEVYAEAGHPPMFFFERVNGHVVRTPITDLLQWINRLKTIDMDRACGHISDIIFDTDQWSKQRGGPIFNYIKIKPYMSTVYGPMFKENLDSPKMNTSMSIRTVTAPQTMGSRTREVEYFTNYDWVVEPGMAWANKHQTAGLESFHQELTFDENASLTISRYKAIEVIEDGLNHIDEIRSVEGVEAFDNINAVLAVLKNAKGNAPSKIEIQRGSLGLF